MEWVDRRGRQQRTKVTDPSVPVAQEADPIALPEGTGTTANAQRVKSVVDALKLNGSDDVL